MTRLVCLSTVSFSALLASAHIFESVFVLNKFNMHTYNLCMKVSNLNLKRMLKADFVTVLCLLFFNLLELVMLLLKCRL
jgi:hypothetical protein